MNKMATIYNVEYGTVLSKLLEIRGFPDSKTCCRSDVKLHENALMTSLAFIDLI